MLREIRKLINTAGKIKSLIHSKNFQYVKTGSKRAELGDAKFESLANSYHIQNKDVREAIKRNKEALNEKLADLERLDWIMSRTTAIDCEFATIKLSKKVVSYTNHSREETKFCRVDDYSRLDKLLAKPKKEVKTSDWKNINEYVAYLRTQTHLSNVEIVWVHRHRVVKAINADGHTVWFDCDGNGYTFSSGVYADKDWIGNCCSCGKPMFKGDKGYYEPAEANSIGMSWRGCEECIKFGGNDHLTVRGLD